MTILITDRLTLTPVAPGDLDDLVGQNPHLHGRPLGYGTEGKARLDLMARLGAA